MARALVLILSVIILRLYHVRAFVLQPGGVHSHVRNTSRGESKEVASGLKQRHISTARTWGSHRDQSLPSMEPNGASDNQCYEENEPTKDTIRVRIWRALASGDELSMTQLSKQVRERRGDVRSHLTHVERQAKTIRNKSNEWRIRRGLAPLGDMDSSGSANGGVKKLRLKKRKGAKNELFIRLV